MLEEHNVRLLAAASFAALAAGLWFGLSALEWCAVVGALALAWVAEGLNTAPSSPPFRPASSSSAAGSSNIAVFAVGKA